MPCSASSASSAAASGAKAGMRRAVAPLGLGPDVVGLGEQAAGVERDDLDVRAGFGESDRMRDRLVLEAEARGEHKAAGKAASDQRKPTRQRSPAQGRSEFLNLWMFQPEFVA